MNDNRMSEAEMEIMEYLWTKCAGTGIGQICKYFNECMDKSWKQQTVRTFLTRLKTKGYIKTYIDTETQRIVYVAAMSKQEYLQTESKKIIDSLFGGSLNKFVSAFTGNNKLSKEDVEELRKLLDE